MAASSYMVTRAAEGAAGGDAERRPQGLGAAKGVVAHERVEAGLGGAAGGDEAVDLGEHQIAALAQVLGELRLGEGGAVAVHARPSSSADRAP